MLEKMIVAVAILESLLVVFFFQRSRKRCSLLWSAIVLITYLENKNHINTVCAR